jgi:excisionase family DNA binding protein
MEKQNLNSQEAAEFLCVSLSKLMKLCHNKEIGYCKVGRLNVFRLEELRDFLEKNRVHTTEELQQQAAQNCRVINKKENPYRIGQSPENKVNGKKEKM